MRGVLSRLSRWQEIAIVAVIVVAWLVLMYVLLTGDDIPERCRPETAPAPADCVDPRYR